MQIKEHRLPLVVSAADPWVVQHGDEYYYCRSVNELGITVTKAPSVLEIGQGKTVEVWTPPASGSYSHAVWAPELHFLDGRWYIYFAADDGDNHAHRMYVLESDSDDALGKYHLKGKITDPTDRWAIDGTILQMNGVHYFIWSGWDGEQNEQQNLYIAPMSNPWTISGERVCISQPEYDWELHGHPAVNEGPQVLKYGKKVHIIYSASGSWTDEYCLGHLTLTGDDPLKAEAWQKTPQPVFTKTEEVVAPGHASFVQLHDQSHWIIYHVAQHAGAGWNRNVHAQPFGWTEEGMPVFGEPLAQSS